MPQRNCTKDKDEIAKAIKRITLPIEMEKYKQIVGDPKAFRTWIDGMITAYPALFPVSINQGYTLHDDRQSKKMPTIML